MMVSATPPEQRGAKLQEAAILQNNSFVENPFLWQCSIVQILIRAPFPQLTRRVNGRGTKLGGRKVEEEG